MRVVFIVAPGNYRDEELFNSKSVLEQAGVRCDVASTQRGALTGSRGASVKCDMLVGEISARHYDAVVFIGGSGVQEHALEENNTILSIAREFASAGKVVAAICIAPRILAKAGLLQGKRVTCFPDASAISLLRQVGAHYAAKPVEIDGKLVTANGPQSASAFGQALLDVLG